MCSLSTWNIYNIHFTTWNSFSRKEVPLSMLNAMALPLNVFSWYLTCSLRAYPLRFLPPPLPLPYAPLGGMRPRTQVTLCPSGSTLSERCRHSIADCAYHSIQRQHVVSTHDLRTLRVAESQSHPFPDYSQISPSSLYFRAQMPATLSKPMTRTPMKKNYELLKWLSFRISSQYANIPEDIPSLSAGFDHHYSPCRKIRKARRQSPGKLQSMQYTRPMLHLWTRSTPVSRLSPYLPSTPSWQACTAQFFDPAVACRYSGPPRNIGLQWICFFPYRSISLPQMWLKPIWRVWQGVSQWQCSDHLNWVGYLLTGSAQPCSTQYRRFCTSSLFSPNNSPLEKCIYQLKPYPPPTLHNLSPYPRAKHDEASEYPSKPVHLCTSWTV